MRYIEKGKEPKGLAEYRNTPKAAYPCPCAEEWGGALLKEQGYLCAYTLQRIDMGKLKKEHLKSQNGTIENDLNHKNVVAVCMGGAGTQNTYADTRKAKRELDNRLHPTNPNCETYIKYRGNGDIYSDVPELHAQMVDLIPSMPASALNLNHPHLVSGRKGAYKAALKLIKIYSKSNLQRVIRQFSEKDKDGRYAEYCSFVIYRLNKKLQGNA